MTETRKTVRRLSGEPTATRRPSTAAALRKAAPKKPSASKKTDRDDYDAFLEEAEQAERAAKAKRSSADKAPVGRHSSEAQKKSGASAAQKKNAARKKLEGENARPSRSAAAPKKAAPKKKVPARKAVLLVDNDPYDDFLREAEAHSPKKKGSQRKNSKAKGTALALLMMIGCVVALAGWQYTQYQTFLTMKAAVDRATFYEGTYVEGVDVSGMTLEQAREYWATGVEPGYSQRKVTLSNGATFTAEELGYSSDYAAVLTNAWSAGRSGSLVERYEALSQRRDQTANYRVTRMPYTAQAIENCVSAIAEQIDRPAEDAKIASFDTSSYVFQFTDEVVGSQLDTNQLASDMASALDAGGGTVELVVRSIQPEVVKADISEKYGMIASAVTNASSSSSNRLANIKRAIELISGTCLKPGETFSFNGVVGERTTDRGFKTATAYSSGTVVEEVGGGICQVSTTLFNAAVKADLEIVERHNHSLTVGYVDKGKDAAVNWGSQDLRFTNTTDDNIYICCYLDGDKRVRFGIFGKLLENGEYITVESETTGHVDYETEYRANASLPTGATQVVQNGKQGYKAVAYKIRWDKNGSKISSELLCKSTYKATKEIIEYGP